jgi:hypothetical protein
MLRLQTSHPTGKTRKKENDDEVVRTSGPLKAGVQQCRLCSAGHLSPVKVWAVCLPVVRGSGRFFFLFFSERSLNPLALSLFLFASTSDQVAVLAVLITH